MKGQSVLKRLAKVLEDVDRNFWIAGELLSEVKAKKLHQEWGYEDFGTFCEQKLGISAARGSRLSRVCEIFGDYRETQELDQVSFTCLAEALPVVKKANIDEAITLAKEGLEAIRRWKEARKVKQRQLGLGLEDQKDWHRMSAVRLPPDGYRDWITAENYVRVILGRQGIKVDDLNPWRVHVALAQSALEGLAAQLSQSDIDAINAGIAPDQILTGTVAEVVEDLDESDDPDVGDELASDTPLA